VAECRLSVPASGQEAPADLQPAPTGDPFWPPGRTFERVLQQARTREADALSLLYRRFLPAIYRFHLARVGEVATAEDLTSETFFAAMASIDQVRAQDELGFATWVLGIARHKLSQHYRILSRRREIALAEATEPPATAEQDDPLAIIMARERWTEVVAALNRLTPEQRLVVLHRCILGHSTDEVAAMMDKPANAIYGLQFRALAALERHLGHLELSGAGGERTPGPAREGRNGHAARRKA
jgi:RNA polymerase sigma-70 factor, ECF subfamily